MRQLVSGDTIVIGTLQLYVTGSGGTTDYCCLLPTGSKIYYMHSELEAMGATIMLPTAAKPILPGPRTPKPGEIYNCTFDAGRYEVISIDMACNVVQLKPLDINAVGIMCIAHLSDFFKNYYLSLNLSPSSSATSGVIYGSGNPRPQLPDVSEWNPFAEPTQPKNCKCECGAASVGVDKHADWCPMKHLEPTDSNWDDEIK